jgi:hypothetical protein
VCFLEPLALCFRGLGFNPCVALGHVLHPSSQADWVHRLGCKQDRYVQTGRHTGSCRKMCVTQPIVVCCQPCGEAYFVSTPSALGKAWPTHTNLGGWGCWSPP